MLDRRLIALLACASSAGGCGSDPCAEGEPGTICAVAGTGETGFNGDEHAPGATDLYLPTRALRGPDGLLYILDFNNSRIRRIDADGLVRTVAGNGAHGFSVPGVPALESPLDNPTDFAFDPAGRMLIVSFEEPRVIAIDEEGIVRILAGAREPGLIGDEGDGLDPTSARFMQLEGIAVTAGGTIYLADAQANRVRVIANDIVDTFAGTGEAGYTGDGGPATAATLDHPTALALGPDGSLYVADSLNHAVRKIDPSGTIETVAGTGSKGLSGDGGPATAAQLDEPYGLAVDGDGTLFIADRSNFRVRRVGPDGTINSFAGTIEGYAGDGGAAIDAELGFLARLSIDENDLLIADQSNSCIRRVVLDP